MIKPRAGAPQQLVDGLNVSKWGTEQFQRMKAGGITASNCTIAVMENFRETISEIATWYRYFRENAELIRPIQSPPKLDHRYLHEDVGWGLVPWMHLAAAAGSPAPTITALTHLAGVINGIDYPREGLTLERMGLAGKTPGQIRAHVGVPTAELTDAAATKS